MVKVFGIIFILLGLLMFSATPVLAIDNPTSITVQSVRAFENILETGDMLFVVEYKVMFDPDPPEDPEDTYMTALYHDSTKLDPDRHLVYYDHNVISVYVDATEAAALTWGHDYNVRVMVDPTVGIPVEGTNMVTRAIGPSEWIAGAHDDSIDYLGTWVVGLADTLETSHGSPPGPYLTDTDLLTEAGMVLFDQAIPGLASICPTICSVAISGYTWEGQTYTRAYQTALQENIGDRLQNALSGIGAWVGVSGTVIGGVGLAIIYFILAGRIFLATGNTAAAVILSIPLIFLANLIGLVPLVVTFVAAFLVLILFGIVFILGRFT